MTGASGAKTKPRLALRARLSPAPRSQYFMLGGDRLNLYTMCVRLLTGEWQYSMLPTPPAPAGFVAIPAGTFTMGSPLGELGRGADETQHSVT